MKVGGVVLLLLLSSVCGVPMSPALRPSLLSARVTGGLSDLQGVPYGVVVDKRNQGVDAWSICPPQMTDVDCFYAYLRVYARLRKAAEESDRVSMRNIGKRSSLTSLPSESNRARSRLRRVYLCSDDMPPALCYLTALQPYDSVLGDIDTNL